MIGYALGTHEPTSLGSDEQVVLDAYSTEVLVFFKFVEVEELGAVPLASPQVNEVWNEVYARLVGNYKPLFQPSSHA